MFPMSGLDNDSRITRPVQSADDNALLSAASTAGSRRAHLFGRGLIGVDLLGA